MRNRHVDPVPIEQKVQASWNRLAAAGAHRKNQYGGFLPLKLIDCSNSSVIAFWVTLLLVGTK